MRRFGLQKWVFEDYILVCQRYAILHYKVEKSLQLMQLLEKRVGNESKIKFLCIRDIWHPLNFAT